MKGKQILQLNPRLLANRNVAHFSESAFTVRAIANSENGRMQARPNKVMERTAVSLGSKNCFWPPSIQCRMPYSTLTEDVACKLRAEATGIPGCTFKYMDPSNVEEVHAAGALLADVFINREPISHAIVGGNKKMDGIFRSFCQVLSAEAAASGASLVAKAVDGSVIGICMVSPWDRNAPVKTLPDELKPMYDLLERLDVDFERHLKAAESPKTPKVLEIGYGAVDSKFERRGILSSLLYLSILKAHQMGFDTAMTKTSTNSQTAVKRLGFTVLTEIPYKDYEYHGTKPFASVDDSQTVQLNSVDIASFIQRFESSPPKSTPK